MAKETTASKSTAQSGGAKQKSGKQSSANNDRTRALKANTAGVVAYTKGSRFTDAQVMKVVKRVLGQD